MSQTALAEVGHNAPPTDLDPLLERLREDHADLLKRRDALLGAIERSPTEIKEGDEVLAGKLADFVDKQLTAFVKHAEAIHKNDKAPFLQAGRTVDSFMHALIDDINKGKAKVNTVRKAYADAKAAKERRRREEEARLAREEQKRLEREAAEKAAKIKEQGDLDRALQIEEEAKQAKIEADKVAAAAAAKPAELGKSRGVHGGQTTLKQFWNIAEIDRDKIDLEALRPHFTDDALKKAAGSWTNAHKDFLKSGGKLTGARIFEDTRI